MKKILALTGSPRTGANSTLMAQYFIDGAKSVGAEVEIIDAYKINIDFCRGCLLCNIKKQCIVKKDQWHELSKKILNADILVFASPVYFHHVSAALKRIIDRFRSFVNIKMTPEGLIHKPYVEWKKNFVLLLSMGTVEDIDAQPIIDLFEFMIEFLGKNSSLHVIKAKRVAIKRQITYNNHQLKDLYTKLDLPQYLAETDAIANKKTLEQCFELGKKLAS